MLADNNNKLPIFNDHNEKSLERIDSKHRLNILPDNPEASSDDSNEAVVGSGRFPLWLHRKLPKGGNLWKTGTILDEKRLFTVCEEAKCPNLLECWSRKTATFLVMGRECTRSCGFCSIAYAKQPKPLEDDEPERVADSVKQLGLKHVVITQVARDDLEDGGANHLVKIIRAIRQHCRQTTIEILTSDFAGNIEAWKTVIESAPEIFNYNIETVRSLTARVRHTATYERTLQFLSFAKQYRSNKRMHIKSGLMVGLGETQEEVLQTIDDLKMAGCDIITIGQYLQSARNKLLVKSFVTPEQFDKYAEYGRNIGIQHMYCAPFVRSSYNADAQLMMSKTGC